MLGVVLAQALHPPGRMVPARHGVVVGGRHQGVALAQKAAQAAVDKAGLVQRRVAAFGRFNRLVDQRVGGVRRVLFRASQRQRDAQQRIGFGRRRAFGELLAQRFSAAQPAQGVKGQRLNAGAQLGIRIVRGRRHRLTVANGHQNGGCAWKLAP